MFVRLIVHSRGHQVEASALVLQHCLDALAGGRAATGDHLGRVWLCNQAVLHHHNRLVAPTTGVPARPARACVSAAWPGTGVQEQHARL